MCVLLGVDKMASNGVQYLCGAPTPHFSLLSYGPQSPRLWGRGVYKTRPVVNEPFISLAGLLVYISY